ncbi:DUF7344 domain-containing protein [Natronorubrum halalkaliphilum]|uniref:DUF7344 domain-containing protein n=1 Tax=Natronorubrum halalkaliphilum TaxID=2691917 RepID=UPI002E2824AA|nr:hypothetical protein [Natronorubrum halalkaliphilum]
MDEIFRLLCDSRRRRIVTTLEACERNRVQTPELLSWVTREEATVESWRRELYHVHLPMLDDVGLADYDRQDEMIRYYHCELVSDVLDVIDSAVTNRS